MLHSDTMKPVTDDLYEDSGYTDPVLMISTPSARIFRMRSSGSTVCVKTPASDSGLLLDMLKREYRIGVGLNHPYIASFIKWEKNTPAGPGIVMEYVDGSSLDEYLKEYPSNEMRNRIFGQLLDVVEYLHGSGIVHNDLKPSNIMVSRVSSSVKLLDFGFADNDNNQLQRAMGGTVGYASPELVKGDSSGDSRSDIYSLGVLMRDIFGKRYGRISRRCLNSDPARRYGSVAELRKAWMRARRRPRVIMFSVFVVAIILSLGWNFVSRRNSAREVNEAMEQTRMRTKMLSDSLDVLTQSQRSANDSLNMLRRSQVSAYDSIHHLNYRLADITMQQQVQEQLGEAREQQWQQKQQEWDEKEQADIQHKQRLKELEGEYSRRYDNMVSEISRKIKGASNSENPQYVFSIFCSYDTCRKALDADFCQCYSDDGKVVVGKMSKLKHDELWNGLYDTYFKVNTKILDRNANK